MKIVLLSLVAAFLLPSASSAEDGNAAFLFAYWPRQGHEKQFADGYREHLEWHRENHDPLPWYGWHVETGDRIGMFVDGSFGISFAAFDNRVKPAEDGANFATTTAPYGDTAYRKVLQLMPRLGTAARLEDRKPSAKIEVVTIVVQPGKMAAFESCLERLAATLDGADPKPEYAVYRLLSGGMQPSYLVMFPRNGHEYFEENTVSLDMLIEAHFETKAERELLAVLAESVRSAHAETWRYRKTLSYFPAE